MAALLRGPLCSFALRPQTPESVLMVCYCKRRGVCCAQLVPADADALGIAEHGAPALHAIALEPCEFVLAAIVLALRPAFIVIFVVGGCIVPCNSLSRARGEGPT